MNKIKLPELLPEPDKPGTIDLDAHWLAGEGAGSWFVIKQETDKSLVVSRYSPAGRMECSGIFVSNDVEDEEFNISLPYQITWPSHCMKLTLIQSGKKFSYFNQAGKS